MDAHLIDSAIHGDNWSTAFTRDLFAERSRLRRWLEVLSALARAQASVGIIPNASAAAISSIAAEHLDVARIAATTRETSHSTLGLIRELQHHLPESAREHVYLGTTVQDITDTSAVLEMDAVGADVWEALRAIQATLIDLTREHGSTPMIGRTHGQPGAPITFGLKTASWLDEVGRSLERLRDLRDRTLVVQLGGAVGSMAFFGDRALALRRAFADELDLGEPSTSWLTARDRLAEFGTTMAIATAGLGRIANEVFTLQREEIGELRESSTSATVGSITMPHKRNPERSEQIVTLARLVRAQSSSLIESMIQEHERDARGWKAEWVTLPTLCHYSAAAASMTRDLLDGLLVDVDMMMANLHAAGTLPSERLLRDLSAEVGKHAAQATLHDIFEVVRTGGSTLRDALHAAGIAFDEELSANIDTGASAEMAEESVRAAVARRESDRDAWR